MQRPSVLAGAGIFSMPPLHVASRSRRRAGTSVAGEAGALLCSGLARGTGQDRAAPAWRNPAFCSYAFCHSSVSASRGCSGVHDIPGTAGLNFSDTVCSTGNAPWPPLPQHRCSITCSRLGETQLRLGQSWSPLLWSLGPTQDTRHRLNLSRTQGHKEGAHAACHPLPWGVQTLNCASIQPSFLVPCKKKPTPHHFPCFFP